MSQDEAMKTKSEKTFVVQTNLDDETRKYLRIYLTPAQAEEFYLEFGNSEECDNTFNFAYVLSDYRLFENVLEVWTEHSRYEEIVHKYWTPGRAAYQRWRRWKIKKLKQEQDWLIENKDSLVLDVPEAFNYKVVKTGRPRSKHRTRAIVKHIRSLGNKRHRSEYSRQK